MIGHGIDKVKIGRIGFRAGRQQDGLQLSVDGDVSKL